MNQSECSLSVSIEPQPTETTCGPTCLSSVYQYWNRPVPLSRLTSRIGQLDGGGTLAVNLGCDALRRGFQARIVTYNLQIFDPTWFDAEGQVIDGSALPSQLQAQCEAKSRRDDIDLHRLSAATESYCDFLELGGQLCIRPLDAKLIVESIAHGVPILCGLSATYLYMESRERTVSVGDTSILKADAIGGDPQGHFVILYGYREFGQRIQVADPLYPNPIAPSGVYETSLTRVISAILLGIVTYDANLLMIYPEMHRMQ